MIKLSMPLLVLVLGGCATLPDVEYSYYPAKSVTAISVTQTIDCSADRSRLSVTHAPAITTNYSSDRDQAPLLFRTKDLQSAFVDTSVAFKWFDDGRLKSVNLSSTGEGETIVKAAMTLLATAAGGGAPSPTKTQCDGIVAFGGGKPIGILYELPKDKVELLRRPNKVELVKGDEKFVDIIMEPNAGTSGAFNAMKSTLGHQLPELTARIYKPAVQNPVVDIPADSTASKSGMKLKLNKVESIKIAILVDKVETWSGSVIAPTNEIYLLPIPQRKPFGKQEFALELNEAGSVVSMGFTNTSGTAAALNATNTAYAAASPSDKQIADDIAQRQRRIQCEAKPTECK